MSGFKTSLLVSEWESGEFTVFTPLTYITRRGEPITVPAGFITDFASVPGLLQAMPGFDANGDSRRPAVLHDFLYCSQNRPRAECDALFHEALLSVGVGYVRARMFWAGVRSGGWIYYNRRSGGLSPDDFATRTSYENALRSHA